MVSRPQPEPAVRVPEGFEAEFPTADRLATEAFLNLGLLAGAVRSAVEAVVAEEGLPSMAAFNVLSVLGGDPEPLRPSTIADRMVVTRATITGVLDSLEARGLVGRSASPSDGRSREVALTPAGRAVVDRLVPRMHEFERDLMGVVGERRLRELLRTTARLQARVQALASTRLGIR
jgi:DNA-binding MarR family transcriptional regulator